MNLELREDLQIIFELIEENSTVLDIGCGNGDLLDSLAKLKNTKGIGIELKKQRVAECISKGLNVIQADVTEGLSDYPLDSFDYVILSITLQEIDDPFFLISEMLRVGKMAIVSIKNLGNWLNRVSFLIRGEIPLFSKNDKDNFSSKGLYLSNMRNFKNFCNENKFIIEKEIPIPSAIMNLFPIFNHLLPEIAVYILKRARQS